MRIVKEMRDENRQLQEVLKQGIIGGTWKTVTAAAALIGMSRSTINSQRFGRSHGRAVLQTIDLLRRKLDGPQIKKTVARSLYEQGLESGTWKDYSTCARILDVDRGALKKYMNATPDRLVTVKQKAFHKKLLQRLRRHTGDKPVVPNEDMEKSGVCTDVQEGVIASPYYDRLLAGVAELHDQNLNGVRFVLTAKNFRHLKGVVTKEEMQDTKLLIEELRRRFTLLAQIEDEDIRAKCHVALGTELDELFLAYRVFKEVIPTAALSEIDSLRAKFAHLQ